MRWRIVRTILRRELRDVLRDRRTLFTMLVLPVLLYPALMLGFSSLAKSRVEELKEQTYPVMITVDGEPLVREGLPPSGSLAARLLRVKRFSFTVVSDPRAAVERGDILLACEIPSDLEERLRARQEVRLEPLHRSADESSRVVWRAFKDAVLAYRTERVPLVIDAETGDQSTPEQKGGHLFGGMLTMMVIMMAMTGAFYPALDVAAGEKERGTLETLLLSPVSRVELVAGKYLTVLAVAVFAALMNLGSMALTFSGFSTMISQVDGSLRFSISPLAFAVIVVGLVIMAALFSAICLAVSTFARTYKEGQAYLTPALLLVMPLAMIGLLPNMQLDTSLAVIPVANMALLMKALLVGNFPGPEIVITLVTCLGCAFAALLWTASLFNREEVLFREGKQVFGLKPPPGVPRPERPPAQAAVLGVLLGVVWMMHVGARLLAAPAWAQIIVPQAGLVALALVLPRLAMVRLNSGLGLSAPTVPSWLAGALVGAGGVGVSLCVGQLQRSFLGEPDQAVAEQIAGLMESLGPAVVVILCVAVVPALAEELLFRGLVLQAFRGMLRIRGAVVLSAVLFGAFHMSVHRFFPQAVLGVVLALLVVRCRSVWPAVLAHATHNGILVIWALSSDVPDEPLELPYLFALAAGGVTLIGLGFVTSRATRTEPSS